MTARTLAAGVISTLLATAAAGQELEPRAYSPSPVGTTFVVVSGTRSSGGVFTDPSVPITDVEATVGILGLGMGHVFALAGRQAIVLGLLPVTWGEASGAVGGEQRVASRRGLADARAKLSVIVWGPRAMPAADFARAPRRTVLGASITVVPPLGQYDSTKLVNLGSHRWALKPEIGLSWPVRRWTIDAYAGVWLFSDNDRYYPGTSTRHQDPITAIQGHVSYMLGRRAWLAVDATWYGGGRSSIDAHEQADLQRNARLGSTLALPIGRRQSLKVSYSRGTAVRIGANFRTVGVAWQALVF